MKMREGEEGGELLGSGFHAARSWAVVCVFGHLWLDGSQTFLFSFSHSLSVPLHLIYTPEI